MFLPIQAILSDPIEYTHNIQVLYFNKYNTNRERQREFSYIVLATNSQIQLNPASNVFLCKRMYDNMPKPKVNRSKTKNMSLRSSGMCKANNCFAWTKVMIDGETSAVSKVSSACQDRCYYCNYCLVFIIHVSVPTKRIRQQPGENFDLQLSCATYALIPVVGLLCTFLLLIWIFVVSCLYSLHFLNRCVTG